MKKFYFLFLLAMLPLLASAKYVEIDGFCYYIDLSSETKTALFTHSLDPNKKYSGDIVIPESVTYDEVTYSVTAIDNITFSDCSELTSVTIPNSVTSIGYQVFINCSDLTSVTIPNSVTSIGNGAFLKCSSLTSVTIPGSVTTIEDLTFKDCTSLTSVTINNGVTSIEGYAFKDCTSLTSVTIPNSVTSIGGAAFSGCTSLTSVTIGNSVTSIGNHVFDDCSGLTSIVVEAGNTVYDSRDNCNAIIETESNNLIVGCKNTTIPNSVTSIDSRAFYGCSGLTSVTIPNSVTSIEYQAFLNCSSLTDVFCLAVDVPSASSDAFDGSFVNSPVLHVPAPSIESYRTTNPWSQFQIIVPYEAPFVADCEFSDVPNTNDFYAPTCYLYKRGVLSGSDVSGKMEVENPLKRAHLAKIAFRGVYSVYGRSVPEGVPSDNYPTVYSDLTDHSTYYYQAARALLYLEYGDGISPFDRNRLAFEAEDKIARVDVLKALMETFNIKPDLEGTDNPFPNDEYVVALTNINPLKMGYVRKAAALGIITTANAEFRPYDDCLRGEAFMMILTQ